MELMRKICNLLLQKLRKQSEWLPLRKPATIDAVFALITFFCFVLVIGISTVQQTIPPLLDESYNLGYQEAEYKHQEEMDLWQDTLLRYDGYINNSHLTEEKYFRYMTKSALIQERLNIQSFIQSFEDFGMTNYPLYNDLKAYKEKINDTLDSGRYLYPYTDWDYEMMAYAIYREAGNCSMEEKEDVGCVILNRQMQGGVSGRLIDPTIEDIIDENKWNGGPIQYPYYASSYDKSVITTDCYEAARRVLEREVVAPKEVIYQALFPQGSKVYHSYYHPSAGTTTYICYK